LQNDGLLNSEAGKLECQAYEFRKRAGEIEIQVSLILESSCSHFNFHAVFCINVTQHHGCDMVSCFVDNEAGR
jgi:hypothetical protein